MLEKTFTKPWKKNCHFTITIDFEKQENIQKYCSVNSEMYNNNTLKKKRINKIPSDVLNYVSINDKSNVYRIIPNDL